MLEIYENIKKYRKACDWTQEELARRVGYGDRSTISRIERGDIDLPQSMILKFADVFGLSPRELMGSDGTAAYMDQLSPAEQMLAPHDKNAKKNRASLSLALCLFFFIASILQ